MNEAKHTPGPWFYDKEEDGGHDTIRATKADILGFTGVISGGRDGDLVGNEADLVLAAAAPELLEALKRFAAYGQVFGYKASEGCPYEQAMAAIAKATGVN